MIDRALAQCGSNRLLDALRDRGVIVLPGDGVRDLAPAAVDRSREMIKVGHGPDSTANALTMSRFKTIILSTMSDKTETMSGCGGRCERDQTRANRVGRTVQSALEESTPRLR